MTQKSSGRSRSRSRRSQRRKSRQQRHAKRKIKRPSRVTTEMRTSDLQHVAKTLGVPFCGLNKTKLVKRINKYL